MPTEPLVLLANGDKWLTESLESVLIQGGYRVIATDKRPQVLELARRHLPDGVLLDMALDQRGSDSLALCRGLRADPIISRATPIILTTAGPALRAQQLDALRATASLIRCTNPWAPPSSVAGAKTANSVAPVRQTASEIRPARWNASASRSALPGVSPAPPPPLPFAG